LIALQLNWGVMPQHPSMSFFSRRSSWSLSDAPDLTLGDDAVRVDIGFLAGDAHREAFASIFAEVVRVNSSLSGATLQSVEARRPTGAIAGPRALEPGAVDLARALYDSRNGSVLLNLLTAAGPRVLGVRFDDPTFWLEAPAP
jgi:hypothetical protein